MHHASQFLTIVNDAKTRIKENTTADVKAMQADNIDFVFVDVREDAEWANGHLPGAIHIGKGVIERDIERMIPDKETTIVLYCGGGFRSALAADNLQKMGYTDVYSMDGGVRGWLES
jgi:rhodanese-related sulfurtransferase